MASDDECYGYESDYCDEDYGGEDDDAMDAEEDTPEPDRPAEFWAITEESLYTAQQQDLSMVMNLLNIKQQHARALLIHHRWKVDCILDHFDRKGRDRMLREAGVVIQENNNGRASPSGTVNCMVCFDEFSMRAVSTMDCGHYFCNGCWTEYFNVSVDSGKKQIRCMGVKCPAICDEAVVHRLLGRRYPDAARRFDRFLLESYLDDNVFVKWCPSVPHCGRAIRADITGERYCEVECPCGMGFCFACGAADAHSPCPCTMWEQWEVKCSGESETINWILANTKNCPKCFKPIVKEDGCNLVTCKCGQHLCWLCGGATGFEHTWTHIANHSCNRFVEEEKKKVDNGKRQLHRYTHFYDRFKIHGDSYATEREKLGPAVEERVRRLEALQDNALIRDGGWLTAAHRGLLRSRQVLSRSYVFAYYMFDDGYDKVRRTERGKVAMAQVLFEDYQEQLERHVERLSKLLATEFLPELVEEEVLREKQDALNLTTVVRTHCGEIYKCIQNELLPLLEDRVEIAAYRPGGPDKAKEFQA